MLKGDLYKTKRTVLIVDSVDDFVLAGQTYSVYMNEVSTWGILDAKDRFIPLAMAQSFGIDWEYTE